MPLSFPDDFLWGASTASYQIEGAVKADGRGPSIWDTFSHTPGKVRNGDTGDVACDHYHRYPEDIALMRELGIRVYRFSTAWPRIQPQGRARANPRGLDFYERLVDAVLAAGITPWLCLYHWDLPQALQDRGGWGDRDITKRFAEYAIIVYERLGDRVRHFATFNEPNVFTILGYIEGLHAPGLRDRDLALKAIHHVNLAHGRAIAALRGEDSALQLGVINNLAPSVPASDTQADLEAADINDALWNRVFPDPQFLGRYPELLAGEMEPYSEQGDMQLIRQPLDYFGLNYYSRHFVARDTTQAFGYGHRNPPRGARLTGMGWEIEPQGFYDQLLDVHQRYGPCPIYITENGAGYEETPAADGRVADDSRIAFLSAYLEAMHAAIQHGVPVKGYFVWSLLDNFEWAFGYAKRFGLVYVDYTSGARVPKKSFDFYRALVRGNTL